MTQDDATLKAIEHINMKLRECHVDKKGSRQIPPTLKRTIVKVFRDSGMTQSGFCDLAEISQALLGKWLRWAGFSEVHNKRVKAQRADAKINRILEVTHRMAELKAEMRELDTELRELVS